MLSPQSFEFTDLPFIGILILLEGLLSADNALVLAIMVKHLKGKDRQKALVYGLVGAFVFRAVAILSASWLISFWWLQTIGAFYLIFITVKHFWAQRGASDLNGGTGPKPSTASFWKTVFLVEVTDIAFAVDSVLVAVSYVSGPDKVWVVYAGAIVGVVLLRFAAGWFTKILDKFPALEHMAYALVGWAGVKLFVMSLHNFEITAEKNRLPVRLQFHVPEMSPVLFWSVMAAIIAGGTWIAVRNRRDDPGLSDETDNEA